MECDSKEREKCTWGLHKPGFGSYCIANYPDCYQVIEYDEPEEELNPIYINVDQAAIPGHILIKTEDWNKVLVELKKATIVREFNEEESVFLNHQRNVCGSNCSICDEERELRVKYEKD